MFELLVVSDSHLSPLSPQALANWDVIVDHVAETGPDLVVHTGDLTQRAVGDPALLEFGRKQLDRLTAPWLAVPGNHDVGDFSLGAGADVTNDERGAAFTEIVGPRCWVHRLGHWRLVGFDTQELLADPERGQAIHDRLLDEVSGPEPTILFQHRPLHVGGDARGRHPRSYVVGPMVEQLEALAALPQIKAHLSGHVHQWRQHRADGTLHVWAPSTWCIVTREWQPAIGTKTVGAVRILLDDADGIEAEVVVPEGMVDNVLGETV